MKCGNCKNLRDGWCNILYDSPDPDIERECVSYELRSNFDRLRNMTVDEIAHAFAYDSFWFCRICKWSSNNSITCEWERSGKTQDECCEEEFKKWLMQEVQDSDR